MLLKMIRSGKIKSDSLITHQFSFDDILKAYAVFENAAQNKALKVLISA
ncbi:hypothetical protein [Rickettsiella massiliensis]|nr:hypothetical protein [Rickettsiella massiliensis]